MSVTAETFQSFISPYSLSRPYFGHLPCSSSSRHSAIAPRKLSCVIGTPPVFATPLPRPFLCWPFNIPRCESPIEAAGCSPSSSTKWDDDDVNDDDARAEPHNAREERNAKDIDIDIDTDEEVSPPRGPRAFTLILNARANE